MPTKKRSAPKATQKPGTTLDIIIETPKGSRNKFKFDEKQRQFQLSKVLPQGMIFPYDFGFVPETYAEDGDPLDVLVLMDEPTFPGCRVECSLIGVIEAEQEEDGEVHRNDRMIAVAKASELYAGIEDLSDLDSTILKQIEKFFVNYQAVRGVRVQVLDRKGADAAARAVAAHRRKKAA
jgi:inorganic pyrophosphatase